MCVGGLGVGTWLMGLWLCRSSEDSMFELLCQLLSPVLKFISRCSKRLIEWEVLQGAWGCQDCWSALKCVCVIDIIIKNHLFLGPEWILFCHQELLRLFELWCPILFPGCWGALRDVKKKGQINTLALFLAFKRIILERISLVGWPFSWGYCCRLLKRTFFCFHLLYSFKMT